MIKNYLAVARRNLLRNKIFTVINVAGLATGLAVFLLIFEFVAHEWNTNRFHKNFARLYRAGIMDAKGEHDIFIAPGYASAIQNNVSGVEAIVRVTEHLGSGVISITDASTKQLKTFREEDICFADGNFMEVFSFPLVAGSASLTNPKTALLPVSKAKQLFGNSNAAGKTITLSNQFGTTDYAVNGVFDDMSGQSDIKPGILLSLSSLQTEAGRNGNDWADPKTLDNGFVNYYTLLKNRANASTVTGAINTLVHTMKPSSAGTRVVLQPLSELHLAPGFNYPYQTAGSLKLVVMLLAVSMLILFIAWVNYINLSTVQAIKRAKETGVRKVLGARRGQLIVQYLTETFLVTICSVVISFVLVQVLQPLFNSFTERNLSLAVLNHGWFWTDALLFVLVGSLCAGGYVAFVLSSFKPVVAIRGKAENKRTGIPLRKGLVVFQFTVSIIFIISTIILYRQLQYMKNSDLGLNLTKLLVLKGPTVMAKNQSTLNIAFKNELGKLAFVDKYAASNDIPGRGYNFNADGVTRPAAPNGDDKKSYHMFIADENFFTTWGIQFAQGKSFSHEEAALGWSKAKKVILNEKAVAALGYEKKDNVVGQQINWAGTQYEIAGVVKDYHHLSLQTGIEPIIFLPSASYSFFSIRTGTDNLQQKIGALNALYLTYFPGNPFEYFFADETFNKQYAAEQQLGNVFIAAALIAILIACLGLFGLAAFTAQQRTKEIGIRKVLGASVASIARLLSFEFVKLVCLAILIASPLAWWAGHKWLQDFAYRTTVSWWIFAVAGMAAIMIAVITVSFQAIKAAIVNPVKSLRTE